MIRILHLHSTGFDFETGRAMEQLAAGLGAGFEIERRWIGRRGDYRNVPLAAWAMRRGDADRADLIHCWDIASLMAAAVATDRPLMFTPPPSLSARSLGWLRAVMGHRHVEVICPSATLRRRCVERGVPLEQCHLIRPGVDFGRIRPRRDPQLRAALGLPGGERVILLAGEASAAGNHRLGIWCAAMLNVVDERYKALLWGQGPEAPRLNRLARHLDQSGLCIAAKAQLGRPVAFEELLPAADLILVTAKDAVATLPIAIAMASALPIVATVTPTVSELLEDRHTALMVSEPTPRALAQRVLDLATDPGIEWSISDMARTEAYEYFAQTRFLSQYRQAYHQAAAGDRVEVPPPAPGAGLRFHRR